MEQKPFLNCEQYRQGGRWSCVFNNGAFGVCLCDRHHNHRDIPESERYKPMPVAIYKTVEDIRYEMRWEWIPTTPTMGQMGYVSHLQMKVDSKWTDVPTVVSKPK